ncbi:MAG TPA: holo-ACP synthase [Nitrospirota bacterium]|nr:holo-ACP synthase [Nitrospirota bacterium]
MIIGIGIDLVKVDRIERAVEKWSDAFTARVFTQAELEYCTKQKRPAEHLAARFGVKEAVMKAFGTGHGGGVRWTDVEVTRDEHGKPAVHLHGKLLELAGRMGVSRTLVSVSHDSGFSVAQAILTGER